MTKRYLLAPIALLGLFAGSAQAVNVVFGDASTLSNMKRVGGNSFDSTGFVTADPSTWPLMDADVTGDGPSGSTVQANSALVYGDVTVVAGVVTAATIKMKVGEKISLATYQTATTTNNLTMTDAIWTYNPVGVSADGSAGTLTHGTQGAGQVNATCVIVLGGTTGQCTTFRNNVNAGNASALWYWDGVPVNYAVVDNLASPANNFTPSSTGGVPSYNAGGASGLKAIDWDLSLFNESTGLGTISAKVTLASLTGNNATAVTATYIMNVVPVPAAAWLFGSALGAMGWLRRKAAA
ncbi:MAG: VPLPA-CTERM sorting domain-containing protein [Gammaproteobacteria bacterium]